MVKNFEINGKVYTLHISDGNIKVGNIANMSCTPGRSCSDCACETCLKDGCYALKSYKQYSNVRKAWDDNTDFAVDAPEVMETALNEYFGKMSAPRFFRIHVGGDFITRDYAEMWARVAAKNPGTRFLAFTKQWDNIRGVDFPENMSIVLSGWENTTIPADLLEKFPVASCVLSADEIPADGFHCPGHCENCGACWELARRGVNVYFVKH